MAYTPTDVQLNLTAVLGMGTEDFPAFYCRKSGCKADAKIDTPAEMAKILQTKWALGLKGGVVIGNPIPEEYELDYDEMEAVINHALQAAKEANIHGKDTTPFLLSHIKDYTKGVSFASNLQLAYNNARVASRIAIELAKLG